jgi:hypothetical protein
VTVTQEVRKTFPKAFCYDLGAGKGFAIASHNYGSIVGSGPTRAKAWRDALAGILGRHEWERRFGPIPPHSTGNE